MADSKNANTKTEYMKVAELEAVMQTGDLIEMDRGAFQVGGANRRWSVKHTDL
jgi:hypothetical protein